MTRPRGRLATPPGGAAPARRGRFATAVGAAAPPPRGRLATALGGAADLVSGLADLVLPASCASCGATSRRVLCDACAGALTGQRPHPVRPTPAPAGLPPCVGLAGYDGVLRDLLLAYKERGRHDAARPLGALLAAVIAVAVGAHRWLILVPVPDTARAARLRYGDHMHRLARHAARDLAAHGLRVRVGAPLRALPRLDSAGLDSAARARAATEAFRVLPQRAHALRRLVDAGAVVVLVDDVVTTGATLAAARAELDTVGVPVNCAAVLAATRKRLASPLSVVG